MYKHIIFLDSNSNIIDMASLPQFDTIPEEAVLFEESEEICFYPPDQEAFWGIFTPGDTKYVPLFHYDASSHTITKRSQEDIDADIASAPPPKPIISQLDRIESQITYTAMMTDTLIFEEE